MAGGLPTTGASRGVQHCERIGRFGNRTVVRAHITPRQYSPPRYRYPTVFTLICTLCLSGLVTLGSGRHAQTETRAKSNFSIQATDKFRAKQNSPYIIIFKSVLLLLIIGLLFRLKRSPSGCAPLGFHPRSPPAHRNDKPQTTTTGWLNELHRHSDIHIAYRKKAKSSVRVERATMVTHARFWSSMAL